MCHSMKNENAWVFTHLPLTDTQAESAHRHTGRRNRFYYLDCWRGGKKKNNNIWVISNSDRSEKELDLLHDVKWQFVEMPWSVWEQSQYIAIPLWLFNASWRALSSQIHMTFSIWCCLQKWVLWSVGNGMALSSKNLSFHLQGLWEGYLPEANRSVLPGGAGGNQAAGV